MNYSEQMREFIVTNFLFGDGASLQPDTSFLDSGIVDSTGIIEIVAFLEETYNVTIRPEEMTPENLDSINRIAKFLTVKLVKASN